MLKLPVIQCRSTTRADIYQTSVSLSHIVPYLLSGHDPRSNNWSNLPLILQNLYLKLQRKTTKSRRDDAKAYVVNRMSPRSKWIGAFPSIVIGMPLPQVFKSAGHEDFEQLGFIKIEIDAKQPNVILDGLGRLTGLLDTLDNEGDDVMNWVKNASIPVTLVTGYGEHCLTPDEMGQLFHDFNILQTPVGKGQALDLDHSDLYVMTTNEVGELPVIQQFGGMDPRATTIGKNASIWTTKTILLKAVRAAAEGPGGHVDHVRDKLSDAWLTQENGRELVARFDDALTTFVDAVEGVPETDTLVRTAAWWIAFGLILHDLYQKYDEGTIAADQRERFIRRMAKIDWGLGNPEFGFLGSCVAEKERKTGEFKPKPVDEQGRPVINRFYGGSKAYYNLAAYIREKIELRETVTYGSNYGSSIAFDASGQVVEAHDQLALVEAA